MILREIGPQTLNLQTKAYYTADPDITMRYTARQLIEDPDDDNESYVGPECAYIDLASLLFHPKLSRGETIDLPVRFSSLPAGWGITAVLDMADDQTISHTVGRDMLATYVLVGPFEIEELSVGGVKMHACK